MKYFLLGVFCTLAVLTLAVLGYIRFGFAEVRSDIPPSRFESSLLRTGVHASLRREAPNIPNPVSPTDQDLWAVAAYIKRMDSLPPAVKEAVDKPASGQH